MIKRNQKFINFLNMLSDGMIIVMSYFAAVYIKFNILDGVVSIDLWHYPYTLFPIIYALAVVIAYRAFRMYGSFRFKRELQEATWIFVINGVRILLAITILYLIKLFNFSRQALFIFYLLSSVLLVLKKWFVRRLMRVFRRHGYNQKHVILVGSGHLAHQYVEDIRNNPHLGITIDGYLSDREREELGKHLGKYEDLDRILDEMDPDELVTALEADEMKYIQYVIQCADKEGARLSMIPFYADYMPSHVVMNIVDNTKLIDMRATPLDNVALSSVKRLMDIIGSALGLILLSPLFIVTAVGVKLSSPGPVFFTQERVGLNKRPFQMLKFRSMRVNDESNTAWSTDNDPRKTRFGSFIRKYSIDELPQLINVLRGDMSLVGPRPEIPFYVEQFKETVPLYLIRQQVRPGITGWAQVHDLRGNTSIEDRVKHDIWYIENWSLGLDILILARTVFGAKFINSEVISDGK